MPSCLVVGFTYAPLKQERQLQLANVTINELREEASQHRQKARELQEQISNDDRVEKLEASLKNTQNRADELEFQLSKLTQASRLHKSHYSEDTDVIFCRHTPY